MDPSVSQIVRVFKEDPLLAFLNNQTVLLVVVKWWKGVSPQIGGLHDWFKDLKDPKLADWDVELLTHVLPRINGALSVRKSKLATIGNHHTTNQTVTHLKNMVCWTKIKIKIIPDRRVFARLQKVALSTSCVLLQGCMQAVLPVPSCH